MGDCRNVVETDGAGPIQAAVPVQTAKYEPTIVPSTDAERLKRRLDTYKQWNSKKSSLQLATAGFIHTGIADKVECQSCGIRLYNWQEEEDPLQAHKKYAPDCEFMLTYFPQIKAPPKPKKILSVKYPNYADFEARLRSFDSWPLKCVAQKPDMMARSGFFYIGSADRARCFHCGVTLRDWDTDDYPPCAHRQWSEHCPFVQQLDVDGMRAEIEDWEREERLKIEFENSNFFDCSSSRKADSLMIQPSNHDIEVDGDSAAVGGICNAVRGDQVISQVSEDSKDDVLASIAVQAVMEMGDYSIDQVKEAYNVRKAEGIDNPSATQLMETLLDMEDR